MHDLSHGEECHSARPAVFRCLTFRWFQTLSSFAIVTILYSEQCCCHPGRSAVYGLGPSRIPERHVQSQPKTDHFIDLRRDYCLCYFLNHASLSWPLSAKTTVCTLSETRVSKTVDDFATVLILLSPCCTAFSAMRQPSRLLVLEFSEKLEKDVSWKVQHA